MAIIILDPDPFTMTCMGQSYTFQPYAPQSDNRVQTFDLSVMQVVNQRIGLRDKQSEQLRRMAIYVPSVHDPLIEQYRKTLSDEEAKRTLDMTVASHRDIEIRKVNPSRTDIQLATIAQLLEWLGEANSPDDTKRDGKWWGRKGELVRRCLVKFNHARGETEREQVPDNKEPMPELEKLADPDGGFVEEDD